MSFKSQPQYVYPHAQLPYVTETDVPQTPLMQCLYRALRTRRAGDSMAEARFVSWLVHRLPVTMIDAAGNIHVDLRTDPQHRTMFTAHTDTVHRSGGPNSMRLDRADPAKEIWRADEGQCLGADDGAGIALLYHMIVAGVKGYYVFFRGEEHGGIGSSWLAKNMAQCLKDIDHCVSLDRAGYSDVITHQGRSRCCSDEFAQALAEQLTPEDFSMAYVPDSTGVFTDSANLVDHIPECTNLSVGYKSQHGDGEWQDVTFLQQLADQLLKVRWDTLPVKRDPKAVDEADQLSSYAGVMAPWLVKALNDEDDGRDDFTEDLIYAIEDALFGSTYPLIELIAAHALPDEPSMAEPHVRIKNVNNATLEAYGEALKKGDVDADWVLDQLVSECINN